MARYGYLQGCLEAYEYAPHLLADPDGWTWVASSAGSVAALDAPVFTEGTSTPILCLKRYAAYPHQAGVGADVSWRVSTAPAGAGYFMVGDAASLLDPAASHGVLKALMSGMQAAQALFDSLQRPPVSIPAQVQYSRWVSDWFARDLAQMRHFYATHPCPPAAAAS